MLYSHRPEFLRLLQKALQRAASDIPGYSDEKFVTKIAHLPFSKSKLHRFRKEAFSGRETPEQLEGAPPETRDAKSSADPLDPKSAELLWNYLDANGYIAKVRDDANRRQDNKGALYDTRTAANVMGEFYEYDPRESISLVKNRKLKSRYLLYKGSFRKNGCVVKSLLELNLVHGEYFEAADYQSSTGKYEVGHVPTNETAKGFGFVRDERLWLFLKEESAHQPRIFCFYKWIQGEEGIARALGRVLESDKRFGNDFYGFRVGLASMETDRGLWKSEHPDEPYDEKAQLDNFPFSDEAKKRYHADDKICLDPLIMDYICDVHDEDTKWRSGA